MHRVTKWRAAWQAPHQLHHQEACGRAPTGGVEEELAAWHSEWMKACPAGEAPLWRQGNGRDLGVVDTAKARKHAKACKKHTGLGADSWHPWHLSWLSDQGLACLGKIWQWAEMG